MMLAKRWLDQSDRPPRPQIRILRTLKAAIEDFDELIGGRLLATRRKLSAAVRPRNSQFPGGLEENAANYNAHSTNPC
jgi:hypothetical protein